MSTIQFSQRILTQQSLSVATETWRVGYTDVVLQCPLLQIRIEVGHLVRFPRQNYFNEFLLEIDQFRTRQSTGALAQRYVRVLVVVYDFPSVNFNFCPVFDKKFALDESQFENNFKSKIDFKKTASQLLQSSASLDVIYKQWKNGQKIETLSSTHS